MLSLTMMIAWFFGLAWWFVGLAWRLWSAADLLDGCSVVALLSGLGFGCIVVFSLCSGACVVIGFIGYFVLPENQALPFSGCFTTGEVVEFECLLFVGVFVVFSDCGGVFVAFSSCASSYIFVVACGYTIAAVTRFNDFTDTSKEYSTRIRCLGGAY